MPNAVMKAKSERRRPFIGDQLDDCRDVSGLYYILPMQKVFIIFETNKVQINIPIYYAYLGIFDQLGHSKRYMGLCVW